jgi:hypothetical protein
VLSCHRELFVHALYAHLAPLRLGTRGELR